MKKTIKIILVLISFGLLCGCSYSDLTGGSGNSNNGDVDIIDNEENKASEEKIVYFSPNETFTVPGIAEITITSVSAMEEVKPPKTNGVYSYQSDQAGETYVVAKGTFKNLLSDTFDDWDNYDGMLVYDNNYEYSSYVKFATDSDNDFYTDPKPLQTLNVYFIASVPSDLVKSDKTFSFKLKFVDNSDVSSDTYQYNFIFNN